MFQWLVFLTATVLWSGTTAIVGQQVAVTELAGGRGGREFTDSPPSPGARILEIQIRAGDTIDAIQAIYLMPDGRTAPGPQHGGRGGNPGVFRLDSDETILGISGRYGNTVDSLRFHTNKRTSPLFGGRGGDRDYRIDVPNGSQFAGFTGRSGNTIDAIGLALISGYDMNNRRGAGLSNQPGSQQVMETEIAGGRGGSPFSDRDFPPGTRLVEIRIASGDTVDSIQGIYQIPNGRIVEGARHGGGGGRVTSLRLDSDEFVIGLSGRYGDTIDSMRIQTNKRASQQFGGRGGDRDYRIDVPGRNQAIGFVGRSGSLLDAVGLIYTTGSMGSPWRRPRP
jgi:hypothetical protein